MQKLQFHCEAGAAGDMLLGALLDVLRQRGKLELWKQQMASIIAIEPSGRAEISAVQRAGKDALKVDFFIGEVHADHASHAPHHHRPHRHLKDIRKIFAAEKEKGLLPENALALADTIFLILAEAEAIAHECELEKVHFHEVGAYDSILDIVGFATALELLGPADISSTPVMLGAGQVMTDHGLLDVPTPAVREILKAHPFPSAPNQGTGECLTPTGAAMLAAVVKRWDAERKKAPSKEWGVGAGTRNPESYPNVVEIGIG